MKSKKLVMFIVLGLLLAAGAAWYAWDTKFSPEARHKTIARSLLKDPDSAQFRFARRSKRDTDTWCGELNARNSMGGMVGFKRYVLTTPKDPELLLAEDRELFFLLTKMVEDGDGGFTGRWRAFCED